MIKQSKIAKKRLKQCLKWWNQSKNCQKRLKIGWYYFFLTYFIIIWLNQAIVFMGESGSVYKSDSLKNLLPLMFDKKLL